MMKIFLLYLFLFIMGCFIGWIIELFYRRFYSAKKWVNPGFLKGPWLPLYGFGVILMFSLCYLCINVIPDSARLYNPLGDLFNRTTKSGPAPLDIIPIILMGSGMVLLEYVAGIVFVKGFHVKLWDYSNMKGNIKGIICPVFTVIWFLVAVLYYYLVNPFMYKIASKAYDYMFGLNGDVAHFGFIFTLGVIYGLFIYDVITSVGVFNAISKYAKESGLIAKAEEIKLTISKGSKASKDKITDMIPQALKDKLLEKSNKPKPEKSLKDKINEKIFIDPTLTNLASQNYDEKGRPIKYEDEKDK